MSLDCYQLSLLSGPSSEPVTLAECKLATRIESTSEDDFLDQLITAAREQIEVDSDLKLMPQTWRLTLEQFPWCCGGGESAIELPIWPVSAVTVKYDDVNGTEQTLPSNHYYLRSSAYPAVIYPEINYYWPVTSVRAGSVRIDITAGFASAAAVPMRAKQALFMLFGHWVEHRHLSTSKNYSDISFAYQALTVGLRPGMV